MHKNVSIARRHFCAHGGTFNLLEKITIESEKIILKNEMNNFGQITRKFSISSVIEKKFLTSKSPLLMWNVCIQ